MNLAPPSPTYSDQEAKLAYRRRQRQKAGKASAAETAWLEDYARLHPGRRKDQPRPSAKDGLAAAPEAAEAVAVAVAPLEGETLSPAPPPEPLPEAAPPQPAIALEVPRAAPTPEEDEAVAKKEQAKLAAAATYAEMYCAWLRKKAVIPLEIIDGLVYPAAVRIAKENGAELLASPKMDKIVVAGAGAITIVADYAKKPGAAKQEAKHQDRQEARKEAPPVAEPGEAPSQVVAAGFDGVIGGAS